MMTFVSVNDDSSSILNRVVNVDVCFNNFLGKPNTFIRTLSVILMFIFLYITFIEDWNIKIPNNGKSVT